MSCDPDAILDYLDGGLSPVERERLERHMQQCEACARLLEQQQIVDQAVVRDLREDVPERLSDAEMESLLSALPRPEVPWRDRLIHVVPRAGLVLAAAAAVAFLLVPRPAVDPGPRPDVLLEPPVQDRVELRMSTGDPTIQVVWVMDRNLQL